MWNKGTTVLIMFYLKQTQKGNFKSYKDEWIFKFSLWHVLIIQRLQFLLKIPDNDILTGE